MRAGKPIIAVPRQGRPTRESPAGDQTALVQRLAEHYPLMVCGQARDLPGVVQKALKSGLSAQTYDLHSNVPQLVTGFLAMGSQPPTSTTRSNRLKRRYRRSARPAPEATRSRHPWAPRPQVCCVLGRGVSPTSARTVRPCPGKAASRARTVRNRTPALDHGTGLQDRNANLTCTSPPMGDRPRLAIDICRSALALLYRRSDKLLDRGRCRLMFPRSFVARPLPWAAGAPKSCASASGR